MEWSKTFNELTGIKKKKGKKEQKKKKKKGRKKDNLTKTRYDTSILD